MAGFVFGKRRKNIFPSCEGLKSVSSLRGSLRMLAKMYRCKVGCNICGKKSGVTPFIKTKAYGKLICRSCYCAKKRQGSREGSSGRCHF